MNLIASTIIDRLGGTTKTAALCQVTKASVSDWRKRGIPRARLMYLRLARPEVFAGLEIPAHKAG